MQAADREVAWEEQFLAARELMKMLKRLERLIDALESRSDEVLSEDDPTRIDFVREYRQVLKDGIRVMSQNHVAIEDAELLCAIEAGIEALGSETLKARFVKGMTEYMNDDDDNQE